MGGSDKSSPANEVTGSENAGVVLLPRSSALKATSKKELKGQGLISVMIDAAVSTD